MKCDVCRNYPTFEVSVIESQDDKILHLGNDCIDRLTGRSVSGWFRCFRRKRESVMANRKYIDQLPSILDGQNSKEHSLQLTEGDAEKLRTMLEQTSNGQNPTTGQEKIAVTI
jgi:hypothetical protein